MTSGLEGAWTATPTAWSVLYLDNLLRFDWKKTKSPAGATQWIPTDPAAANLVPDAHDPGKRHAPIMFTTDIALKEDPGFRKISERFLKDPKEFDLAFAKAWFKLTHRDLGPRTRYVGAEIPAEVFVWQDPVPAVDHKMIDDDDVEDLKETILASGLTVPELVRSAWASASTFRGSDLRGGANGARIRLAPQKDWPANDPAELAKVLTKLEGIQKNFNDAQRRGKKVSLADVIVLGGAAAIENMLTEATARGLGSVWCGMRDEATEEQGCEARCRAVLGAPDDYRVLALVGFGLKAGFVPFHVWLPEAHPAAPSHVSALLSGVMTKVAVYGFVRIVFDLLGDPAPWWAMLVLVLAGTTTFLGVMYALMQHDLKRLLAYHTVENIGIIFIGLGLALAFESHAMRAAAALAFTAALFHVFDAAQGMGSFVLRGYRQTFWPMVIYGVTLWGLGLGGGAWVAFSTTPFGPPRGALGFWEAAAVALAITAVALVALTAMESNRRAAEQ